MKDYTVIYMVRHHNGSVTKYQHITCIPTGIKKCVEEEHNIDFGSVWFIFDGHCNQTLD